MTQKIIIRGLISLLCLFSFSSLAMAEDDAEIPQEQQRFALVIGNKNYEQGSYYRSLTNPIKDAEAIRDFLIKSRFKPENILYVVDGTLKETQDAIDDLMQRLRKAKKSVAFVYYSGHGTQESSRLTGEVTNYLIPIDNKRIQSISDLDHLSVSLNHMLSKLDETNHGLNIVLVDACRNELPATNKSSSILSLAPISAQGVFVAYATASGNAASDDSLFRKSFIKQASQPQKLTDIFPQVKKMFHKTGQLPIVEDRTVGAEYFYFTGSADDDPKVLKSNYHLAKAYENKALLAMMNGDRTKDLTEYRKAWLYGLEARKLKVPEGKVALKQGILNQLTDLSAEALNPERYATSVFLDIGSSVGALIYSPDGGVFVSGLDDGTIKFWDSQTGKLKQILQGHKKGVNALSYSPDGGILASGSDDQTIKLWDGKTGQLKQTLQGHDDSVNTLSYSPDGSILASGSLGTICLWNSKTGQLKQTLDAHDSIVTALSYSPNEHIFASGSDYDQTIKLWDSATGKLKQILQGHEDPVISLSYSPDGGILASGSDDQTIKLWDSKTGKLKQTLKGHEARVSALSYSSNGSLLVSGSWDNTIKLWDSQTGQLKQTLKGHTGGVNTLSYSPDGDILASGSDDQTIKLWDSQTGKLKQTLKGHTGSVNALSYSPNGGILASGSDDQTIKLWDSQTGQLKQTLQGHKEGVTILSYSPNGFLTSSGENEIKHWTPVMLKTQALFYKYNPQQVSVELQFLWEMGLDDDFTFVHKVRTANKTQFLPLLNYPPKGKTKTDQLIQWLEDKKAYKKQ